MTVAPSSGKESSRDCSCMRTLSPTCKPFQSNGVTAVSSCPSAHRGERVSSPRRAVRHGGHSHHVACAAASRLASPGKASRHRPQRRDGGGRSTSAALSARRWPACAGAVSSCCSDIVLVSPPEQCRQGDSTDEGDEQFGQRASCSPSHCFGLDIGHVARARTRGAHRCCATEGNSSPFASVATEALSRRNLLPHNGHSTVSAPSFVA
jgi:hypothetical protein